MVESEGSVADFREVVAEVQVLWRTDYKNRPLYIWNR